MRTARATLRKETDHTSACPRAGTDTPAGRHRAGTTDRHHSPYDGTPVYKGTDNAPTSGRNYPKPLERAHTTHPLADQTLTNGSTTSRPTSVRATTTFEDGRGSLSSARRGAILAPHYPTYVRHGYEKGISNGI